MDHPGTLMKPQTARNTATHLNADVEDDWTYKAVHKQNGPSFVEIYDEDNLYLGVL